MVMMTIVIMEHECIWGLSREGDQQERGRGGQKEKLPRREEDGITLHIYI
jgi:hypothetical protein